MNTFKTKMLIDRHIHGGFGVDINKADSDDLIYLAKNLYQHGIGGFYPTLVTDSVSNINKQVEIIKKAASKKVKNSSEILGIHLEGIFINPLKKGIHDESFLIGLTKENYQKIEDDFIKIVTLAPELDNGLIEYLKLNRVQIQAGHCIGTELKDCIGVTHLFNAMGGINHRERSTVLSALIDDRVYTEIIADGVHLSNDILKLVFRLKPIDKIILISDALPITLSDLTETEFAGTRINYDGKKSISEAGTIAGSTTFLDEVVKLIGRMGLFEPILIENPYALEETELNGYLVWDEDYNIIEIIGEKDAK